MSSATHPSAFEVSRAAELRELLTSYNEAYYAGVDMTVTDGEYDLLMDELAALEELHPALLVEDSPTQKVGTTTSELFNKVRHQHPMLSLGKATTEDAVRQFVERFPGQTLAIWPKFDGISLSVTYENGHLVKAVTRGDGTVGDDITDNVRAGVRSLPLTLKRSLSCEVRGEIIMRKSDFNHYNQVVDTHNAALPAGRRPLERLKNPRNGAAGTIRQKDPKKIADRPLTFMPFDMIADGVNTIDARTLTDLGFQPDLMTVATDADQVLLRLRELETVRPTLDYLIDGVVIRVLNRSVYEAAGTTSKYPKGAVAFKFAAQQGTTRLLDVDFTPGKTGKLTPRARLEPVDLDGSTVEYASLANLAVAQARDIRIGDLVVLHKANDVIPQIIGPSNPALRDGTEQIIEAPSACPSCGGQLVEVGDSRELYCENVSSCPAQNLRRITHWASRAAADIDGLSEQRISALIDADKLDRISDLYRLTYDDLMPSGEPLFDGLGERSSQNLLDAINTSKTVGLRRALIGWSIPLASEGTAKRLCRAGYETIERVADATFDDLTNIEDIGPKVAESLHTTLRSDSMQSEIATLRALGVSLDVRDEDRPVAAPTSGAFVGKTVVITGTLTVGRKEFQTLMEQSGAKASSSISAKTDYLVAGENAGSKLDKAASLGVAVLTEDEARGMLGGG